jgi:hypothetical protein
MTLRRLVQALTLGTGIAYLACGDEATETPPHEVSWDCEYIGDRNDGIFCEDAWECQNPQRIYRVDCDYSNETALTNCDCLENGVKVEGGGLNMSCYETQVPLEIINDMCHSQFFER